MSKQTVRRVPNLPPPQLSFKAVGMSYDSKSKQRSKYMFSDHHMAIIDSEQFDAVAEEKKRRSNIEYDDNGVHRKHTRYTTTKALQK